jgi:hypothetical protein
LFLYSAQFSLEFHVASIAEMCRVAGEARIFPLLQMGGAKSPHPDSVVGALTDRGLRADFIEVPYEFQRGGNWMLRVVAWFTAARER